MKRLDVLHMPHFIFGVTFPPISPSGKEIVRTLRNIFPSAIALTKSDICFPLKSLKKAEGLKLPWVNTPFILPVEPDMTESYSKIISRLRPPVVYSKDTEL